MKKAFLQLHISILLAGWTGVFGKLMMLSPGLIVFWRIVIAGGCLWLWAWLTKRLEKVTPRDRIAIMGVGALLAVQWTLFYASIKASNVSIGVVAFSSIGFFTALIEPLMNRARISLREMLFSLVTIFGISLSSTSTRSTASALLSASWAPQRRRFWPSTSSATEPSTRASPS